MRCHSWCTSANGRLVYCSSQCSPLWMKDGRLGWMKGVRQHYSASPRLCLGGDERGTYARDEAMLRVVNNSITHALSCPEGHSAKSIGTTGEESSQASDLQVSFCASALRLFFFFLIYVFMYFFYPNKHTAADVNAASRFCLCVCFSAVSCFAEMKWKASCTRGNE